MICLSDLTTPAVTAMTRAADLALALQGGGGNSSGAPAAESEGLPYLAIGVSLAVLFLFGVAMLIVRRYKRCPSNKVLVIYGKVSEGQSSRCLHGGGAFVWPLIQDFDYLHLDPMQIEIPLRGALSMENIRVNVPSVFTVAIGTEGAAPVLARRLKTAIEGLLPADLGRVARFAAALRPAVAARLLDGAARRRVWARFFDGPAQAHLLAGDVAKAHDAVERAFGNGGANETERGSVALVGAGPGDPDLLTLKAVRALQAADVIVYDRLVGPRVLELARRDAERIAVGKSPGGPSVPQSEIDALLVDQARAGRRVVRLKGGDPLVFGRAAEELAALRAAGVPVEVVPGITAAAGCAAAIALPLTTRERTRSLTLLTGSAVDGPAEHDWADLARPGRAFAVYMGVRTAGHIERRLRAAGIDPATPVTVVENGTRPEQRVIDGRIDGLADLIDAHRVRGPAIIFVGLARGEAVAATARVVPFPAPDARPERIAV